MQRLFCFIQMKMKDLKNIVNERIVVLDGAMGTMLQRFEFDELQFRGDLFKEWQKPLSGFFDLLTISQPWAVRQVHESYLEAGADIISTNTFNSNAISLSGYSLEEYAYQLNYNAAKIAREAADGFNSRNHLKPRFVAGVLGPTSKSGSISPSVDRPGDRAITFDRLRDAYKFQAEALLDGGADLLLVETVFDTLNAKAALYAIDLIREKRGKEIQVMLSATISGKSGRLLSGQSIEAFITSVSHAPLLSIGLNCSFGADLLKPWMRSLSTGTSLCTSVHPNAGLPGIDGQYEHTPEIMAGYIKDYLKEGLVNIVGGCCGTTPEHIRMIAELAKDCAPRRIAAFKLNERRLKLSGIDSLVVDKDSNFVNIGERTSVSGSRKFLRLVKEKRFEEAVEVAAEQVRGGAQILDVNMDDGMVDGVRAMEDFLNLIASEPDIASVPVMLDSSRWEIIEQGLKVLQGKGVVNSISLKEGEGSFVERAREIRRYGAAVVVMAFDEQGQGSSPERVKNICRRSYDLLTEKVNFPPEDIIFDPNVFPVGTGVEEHRSNGTNFLESVKWIREIFPLSNVSGGVSNVSFSFRGNNTVREAINSAFLYHSVANGMRMGIVNPETLVIYDGIAPELMTLAEDVLLNRNEGATERLVEYARDHSEDKREEIDRSGYWSELSPQERISRALVRGVETYLEEDIEQARRESGDPVKVIEDYLIKGMSVVGELFESGKMFLPQVIRSARVMKKAVSYLLPYLEKRESCGLEGEIRERDLQSAGKIVLATVEGDIHDIGKNIVSAVLSCYNYTIRDVGVMVPAAKIIEAALEEGADIIGVSGLITPSLAKMENLLREMQSAGLKIPVIIGGATTTKIHTAVRLVPLYDGPVIYVSDASKVVTVVNSLMRTREQFLELINEEYAALREEHSSEKNHRRLLSIDEARENRLRIDWEKYNPPVPRRSSTVLLTPSVQELMEFVDWEQFFKAWELKSGATGSESGDSGRLLSEERGRILRDARELAEKIIKMNSIQPLGLCGIYPANSNNGEDIEIYDVKGNTLAILHTLRQQAVKGEKGNNISLADFVMPSKYGKKDYIGLFFVTTGFGFDKIEKDFRQESDEYNAIMARLLADRLAEAFSEYMHQQVRREIWGYSSEKEEVKADGGTAGFRGIRPAPGYPSLPDHSVKQIIWDVLDVNKKTGASLTDSFMMHPVSSVCGFYFAHPLSRYFSVGRTGPDHL